jgi:hypothetical protein
LGWSEDREAWRNSKTREILLVDPYDNHAVEPYDGKSWLVDPDEQNAD